MTKRDNEMNQITQTSGARRTWEKALFWALCEACLLFLIVQHRAVFMHYDDFAYGSLSYGYSANQHGMAWTIMDLVRFLKWHYMSWGGRVLFFSFLIPALRTGDFFLQLLQAMIVWGICLSIYAMLRRKQYDWTAALMTVLVLGSVGRSAEVDGLFWYTASGLYVWPFLPFFAGMLLLKSKSDSHGSAVAAGIFMFIAGFSQEQLAVLVSITLIGNLFLMMLFGERPKKWMFAVAVAGTLGAAIEILAPGNFARAAAYPDFASLSLLDKISLNVPRIFTWLFIQDNAAMILLWVVVLQFLGVSLSRHYHQIKYLYLFNAMCSLGFLAAWIFPALPTVRLYLMFLISGLLVTEIIAYYFIRKNTLYLAMLAGAICSLGMMILSPHFFGRCAIPFYIAVNLLAVDVMRKELVRIELPKLIHIVPALLCIAALLNVLYITSHLYRNKAVNMINHTKLTEYGHLAQLGKNVPSVLLYRVPDNSFTVNMPYWPGNERINTWIRSYYGLPEDTKLIYRSFDVDYLTQDNLKVKEYLEQTAIGGIDYLDCDQDEERITVIGWAAIPNIQAYQSEIYICLDNGSDRYYFKTERVSRPDVADYYGDRALTGSGFNTYFSLPPFQENAGSFRLSLCVVNRPHKYVGMLDCGMLE